MDLGWTLLLTVLALIAIMAGSSFYFQWLLNRMLLNQLRELDELRSSGSAPHRWQQRYLKRAQRSGFNEALWRRQMRSNLKRLMGMTRFAKKTLLMEDEKTRADVLAELSRIRQEWEAKQPGEPF